MRLPPPEVDGVLDVQLPSEALELGTVGAITDHLQLHVWNPIPKVANEAQRPIDPFFDTLIPAGSPSRSLLAWTAY